MYIFIKIIKIPKDIPSNSKIIKTIKFSGSTSFGISTNVKVSKSIFDVQGGM